MSAAGPTGTESVTHLQQTGDSHVAPRTPIEEQLAHIWSDLLGIPNPGVNDHFFDLGGHSLLAVQLLSIIQHTWNVQLSPEIVYDGALTVAELAKAIELAEIQQLSPEEYASLLAEVEALSDEEARALLAAEESAPEPHNGEG